MSFFADMATAFVHGGIWMWPILALHVVAVAIIIERVNVLFFKRKITEKQFAMKFENLIRTGKLEEAVKMAQTEQAAHPLARAIEAGTTAAVQFGGKDEIQGKMDEVLVEETAQLEKRTSFLAMLANAGTLTGLLGTIVGMIKSFAAITYASPVEKATLLSTGISEAMNTTAYGLIMAIPTVIMYAVLSNRSNQLVDDLNQGALKVFNWLSYTYEPIPVRVSRTAQAATNVAMSATTAATMNTATTTTTGVTAQA